MTKAHTDRGKESERILVRYLVPHGFPNAERSVRTGLRTRDRELPDLGDIAGTPGLVWQVKAMKPLTRAENEVPRWMLETERQRAAAGADLGILVVRRDQRPAEQWFAFLPVADLYGVLGGLNDGRTGPWVVDGPWGSGGDRGAVVAWPCRLYLGDLVTLLRSTGWGDPMPETPTPATGGRLEVTG